ncbi:MAG: transposase [Armatimonadota bacterium]
MNSSGGRISEFRIRSRRLPHWEEPGATYFVRYSLRRPHACYLACVKPALIVIASLRFFHGRRLELYDYTVMPDHVHAIIRPIPARGTTEPLSRLLQVIKGWSARQINDMLGRTGSLWQDESYDRLLRGEEDYMAHANYVWENPVRQGLVGRAEEWPWWGRGDVAPWWETS